MSLQLIEGFDHMSTVTKFVQKGWIQNSNFGGTDFIYQVGSGRIAGNSLDLFERNNTNNFMELKKSLPSSYATVTMGVAFKMNRIPKNANDGEIFAMIASGSRVARVFIDGSTGKIKVKNNGGTTIATGTSVLNANSWYYIELKIHINGASGTCEVQLDGGTEIASTTGNFGSTNIDQITLYFDGTNWPASGDNYYDDIYVVDSGGSVNNTFLGDVTVETAYPTADGAHTDWTPDTGTDHYARVNEHSGTYPDDDTSYVSDATVGHRDSYVFSDIQSVGGTIYGVQTNLWARKDDSGTRTICAVTRISGTDHDGAASTLSTSYTDLTEIQEVSPATGVAWTVSEVDGAEFGVKTVT